MVRFFWLVALVLSCMGCASLVWEVIAKLQDDPTITFVSDTSVPISEVILLKAFSKMLEKKLKFFQDSVHSCNLVSDDKHLQ